jgi:hypothetical protein
MVLERRLHWRRRCSVEPQNVDAVSLLAGCVLTVAILWDALEAIVFPRTGAETLLRTRSRYYRTTWGLWAALGRRLPASRRERFLSLYGPLAFVALLAFWAAGLITGFAMMHWSQRAIATGLPGDGQFFDDFYLSGTSLFTLGFGDVVPHNEASRLVAVVEAGIGLMFVTAILSYLPVLHGSIVRRETRLTLLPGWAGSPPRAAEILRRLAHPNDLTHLRQFLHEWESWCAGVLESHLSHPGIAYFRSQYEGQSWVEALVTVLDICTLVKVGIDGVPVWHAQLTFEIARRTAVDLAMALGLEPDHSVDRLPPDETRFLRRDLADAGITLNSSLEADRELVALRRLYEPQVLALSRYLMVPLQPWRT